ncbi:unnamed protein product [Knipowitschia caucasica]|uniref:Gap junction protein n=1 Tax=Knipowitschia caucasica TaxID=637954 RepID=A0AAV2JW82_KNICA
MVSSKDLVLISLSQNISFIGKSWLLLLLLFRALIVLLAGFSLFGDEQERFVCNTIQPGCSNLCWNVFCPVSLLRLWLLLLLLLLMPHVLLGVFICHRVLQGDPRLQRPDPRPRSRSADPVTTEAQTKLDLAQRWTECSTPRFHCAYMSVVILRMVLEAAFATGQFFLFGLSFPKSFQCFEAPCTSGIECYVSRPTEKSLMLNAMLAAAALSVALSFLDLVSSAKRMVTVARSRRQSMGSHGERSSVLTTSEDSLIAKRASPNATQANSEARTGEAQPLYGAKNQLKPPLHPRKDRGPPVTPISRRLISTAANSGQQSDSSDSQDHKRAWV